MIYLHFSFFLKYSQINPRLAFSKTIQTILIELEIKGKAIYPQAEKIRV